jgi:hypothetical protein
MIRPLIGTYTPIVLAGSVAAAAAAQMQRGFVPSVEHTQQLQRSTWRRYWYTVYYRRWVPQLQQSHVPVCVGKHRNGHREPHLSTGKKNITWCYSPRCSGRTLNRVQDTTVTLEVGLRSPIDVRDFNCGCVHQSPCLPIHT